MAAVGGGEVHDEPQLLAGVAHVLLLEHPLLRGRCPREPLVRVQSSVEYTSDCYYAPAYCLQKL